MTLAVFHGSRLWHQILRAFFGELGDKTFLVTVILAAWCPWDGIRGGEQEKIQLFLVFSGSVVALLVRMVILATVSNTAWWAWIFDAVACLFMLLLAARAWIVESKSEKVGGEKEPASSSSKEGDAEASVAPASQEVRWNQDAFAFTAPPEKEGKSEAAAAPYGSLIMPAASADGMLSERISDAFASTLLAPAFSLILVFIMEADDKSESAIVEGGRHGFDRALGAVIGFIPAVMLAVLIGFILERQLRSEQLFFGLKCVLLGLSLISFSQALLHLDVLRAEETPVPVASLLGLFSAVRDAA